MELAEIQCRDKVCRRNSLLLAEFVNLTSGKRTIDIAQENKKIKGKDRSYRECRILGGRDTKRIQHLRFHSNSVLKIQ